MYATDTQKKPASGDWHRADIKAALEKKGFSIRGFARHHHYSPTAVSQALRKPYPRMEALIAREIGVPATAIWPSRYHANGSPKQGRPVEHFTTSASGGRNVSARRA